jgi:hypothetical protein
MELETNEKYNICTAQQIPTCSWIYIEMGEWDRLASSINRDGGRRYGTEVVIQADRRKLCSPSGKLYNTTPQHATLLNGPAKKNA